jgi:hypothetical protein
MSSRSNGSRLNASSGVAVFVTVLSLITSFSARAATAVTPTAIYKIGIYSGSSGATGAYVYFYPAIAGLEGCSITTGNEVWIDFSSPTEPTGKSLYATAVAGWLAGHSVTFEVSGCSDNGQLPLVYNIEIGS